MFSLFANLFKTTYSSLRYQRRLTAEFSQKRHRHAVYLRSPRQSEAGKGTGDSHYPSLIKPAAAWVTTVSFLRQTLGNGADYTPRVILPKGEGARVFIH